MEGNQPGLFEHRDSFLLRAGSDRSQRSIIQVKKLIPCQRQSFLCAGTAHRLGAAEATPVAAFLFASALKGQLSNRADGFSPLLQFSPSTFKGADIIQSRLHNAHPDGFDRINVPICMEGTDGIQHELAVVIRIHKDAFSGFKICNMQQAFPSLILADHNHVRCAKARWNQVAVIHPFLHKRQRFTSVPLHLFDRTDHKLRIGICDLLDLLAVKLLGLWTLYTLMQVFPHLVLANRMGEGALRRIYAARIRDLLLQSGRRRAIKPLLGT